MEKKWNYVAPPDQEVANRLAKAINVNKTLAGVLVQRAITNFDEAKAFFRPSLEKLFDPFLMKDMEIAIRRITKAIENKERILVYGDYDVDGTTAVAMVFHFLQGENADVEYYIPDRYKEGYGLSEEGVNYARKNNFSLIITLDCGIKAHQLVDEGNQSNIDFIICDHHLPSEQIPSAIAILDPKQSNCNYPFKELSGCGIGFKLLQGFCMSNAIPLKKIYHYLDLVAISIASDIVPINGENRTLAFFGLKILNKTPRPGVRALIRAAGLTSVDITGIVFGLGPRINASGRMDHAKSSVDLLLAENEEEILELIASVDNHNTNRKNIDNSVTEEAIQMIENDPKLISAKSTVLFKNNWHKGVIGIVASRCIEKYYRPTIILTEYENKITGSARSVDGFNIYEAISACGSLLERYGGHKYAAGLTLDVQNLSKFQELFEKTVSEKILAEQLIPQIQIDSKIYIDQINYKFYNILKQFEPFGPENMNPVFEAEDVVCKGEPKIIKDLHLKFFAKHTKSHLALEAIGFNMAHYFEGINCGKPFRIAFHIESNHYNGFNYLQLNLKDIKFE